MCTQIGNALFASFRTTGSKSRLNFLECLRAGHTDYVINAAALAYMSERCLSGPVIARLAAHPNRRVADAAAFTAHLNSLGIPDLNVTPDSVCVATEAALFGSIKDHGFLTEAVVISDDAGQFNIGHHALCWIHAERLVHKLEACTETGRQAKDKIRALIWWFYRDLQAYQRHPTSRRKAELKARFDRIFKRRTGFVTLDRLLRRLLANKPELLVVLNRPEIPLHTNGSENDIRCHVANKAFDAWLRAALDERGAVAVIPPKANRKEVIACDFHVYRWRHLTEKFFCTLKAFRRIATRCDKTDESFSSMIHLAGSSDRYPMNVNRP